MEVRENIGVGRFGFRKRTGIFCGIEMFLCVAVAYNGVLGKGSFGWFGFIIGLSIV